MTLQETHRVVLFTGGILSLVVIPWAILARRRTFLKRADLRYDSLAIMWEKILYFKAALDAFLGVILIVGFSVPPRSITPKVLGVLYQLEECITLGIVIRMALHPFKFMLKREDMNDTRQYFNQTLLFSIGGGLLITAPLAAFSSFGHSYSLCWLTSVPMQFYAFFIPAMLCLLFTVSILLRLARVANHRYVSRLPTVYHGAFFEHVARGLELHFSFLAFVGVYPYVFRIASRAYLWQHGRQQPVLAFLEYTSIAFRGPLDALAYMPKDAVVRLYRSVRRRRLPSSKGAGQGKQQEEEEEGGVVRLTLLGKARPLPFFTDQPTRTMAERRIFVSTYNMAECSLDALGGARALAAWVPLGADVYVIGVQECMAYEALGQALLAHMGPEYVMFSKAIGSTQTTLGYHGLIAIWVLAKAKDQANNCFLLHESKQSAVARGKNLGVTNAQNKGGVGIAFRYYDTTFAFLNAHLASDLKGRSRRHKRVKDARQLLLELGLWREEYMVDLCGQHHVCVFMGDLNFRIKRSEAAAVLEDVAAICRRERDGPCAGRQDWRQRRYMELLRAAAGEEERERYRLGAGMAPEEEKEASVGAAAEGQGELELDEEDEEEEDDEEEGGRGMMKRRRLPAFVGGLVREVGSSFLFSRQTAALALRRSLSSYNWEARRHQQQQQQQQEKEEEAATVVELGCASTGEPSSSVPLFAADVSSVGAVRRGPTAQTWGELLEADELSDVMRSGEAFFGFQEPEVRFPPSYRRVKGAVGACGDYTDAERLKQAYSISVKEKRLSFAGRRLSRAFPFSQIGSAASLQQEQGGASNSDVLFGGMADGESFHKTGSGKSRTTSSTAWGVGEGKGRTSRVPSYTDRILVHTFPDYAQRVQVGPYELCDALTASDHRPVSTLMRVQLNVGVRGLQTFQHGHKRKKMPPPLPSNGSSAAAAAFPPPTPQRDVLTVQDAAFYLLELSEVSVELLASFGDAPSSGSPPDEEAAVLCLFPLDHEDTFSILRRPAIVAAVAKTISWLTSEEERDPFAFLSLKSYGSVRRRGLSIVSCNRPEMGGLHASFALCDYRGAPLGSCIIALSDEEGRPIPAIDEGVFPLTIGGSRCGTLRCHVRITQLWLEPT